jgi:hypothetical protein
VYELVATLETKHTIITELEKTMNTQKDGITTEFEKVVRISENLHKEET